MKDSPDQFITIGNWPEINNWVHSHLVIVPDSLFPDH